MPCTAAARMIEGSRLLPSASRFNPIARPISRFSVSLMRAPPFHAASKANRQSRNAVVSSNGTRRKANRASSDSTSPTPTATTSTAPISAPAAASGGSSPMGNTASHQQHCEDQKLQRRAVQNRRQRRPAVIQHHDFVNHRQFEVRVRIVERHAAILREQHREQSRRQQRRARARADGASIVVSDTLPLCTPSVSNAVMIAASAENRVAHFARGAHAFEGRTGVERRARRAESRQREQINEQQRIAAKRQRRAGRTRAATATPRRPPPPTRPPDRRRVPAKPRCSTRRPCARASRGRNKVAAPAARADRRPTP